MKNTTVLSSLVKDPNFKQGQKVGQDELIAAIDRIYDKKYPVVPNAKKDQTKSVNRKKKSKGFAP